MIEIQGDFNFVKAERLLALCAAAPDQPIVIKSKPTKAAVGGQAAVIQALITWARGSRERVVQTYLQQSDDGSVADFARELHGLATTLLAERLLYRDGTPIELWKLRALRISSLSSMTDARTARMGKGPNTTIICADDYPPFDFPRAFYAGEERIVENGRFKFLSESIRDSVGVSAHRWPDFYKMSGLIFELIQNTHDHARLDRSLNVLRPSIRGLYSRLWMISEPVIKSASEDSAGLANYLARRAAFHGRAQTKQIVELSVFDSGPGLADRISSTTGRSVGSVQEEQALVIECFQARSSSKSDSSAGMGLQRALRVLSQLGGFIRVRTGRTSVYADLSDSDPFAPDIVPEFRDWRSGTAIGEGYAPTAGSLITLLLPVGGRA